MNANVAFFIFNRPVLTSKVFEVIRQVKPNRLFIIADGPRADRSDDSKKCAVARAVVEQIDWKCEVLRNYSNRNLGCGQRVATGIAWVFEEVEEAIILEDDCLPNPTFFQFCGHLLAKYKTEPQVMTISGSNWLGKWRPKKQDYHFSVCGGFWGWGTWRRAWQGYDHEMKLWENDNIREQIKNYIGNEQLFERVNRRFTKTYNKEIDTWDFQFMLHCWLRSGLEVVPSVNQISNIGFGQESTHTTNPYDIRSNLRRYPISFPLKEPNTLILDREYGKEVSEKISLRKQPSSKLGHIKEIIKRNLLVWREHFNK